MMFRNKVSMMFVVSLCWLLMLFCVTPVIDGFFGESERLASVSAACWGAMWIGSLCLIGLSKSPVQVLRSRVCALLVAGLAVSGGLCLAMVPAMRALGTVTLVLGVILLAQRKALAA